MDGPGPKDAKDEKKTRYIGLKPHITARLLYEHRYRKPAVEKRDHRLRCGLFKNYRPEEEELAEEQELVEEQDQVEGREEAQARKECR